MQLLFDVLDINYNLPLNLQLYIFIFFLFSAFILIMQVRPMLDKLYTKTPFYWFMGLLVLNLLNIIITLFHYNWRSGTFEGERGDVGEVGRIGKVGDYSKCTKCDETISLDIHNQSETLQKIFINGEIGEVRKPTPRAGFQSMGDMIISRDEMKSDSLKQCHVIAGPTVKDAIDYILISRIPKISNHLDVPVYIWEPVPPDNYVALGSVVTDSQTKPPLDSIGCIPDNCAKEVNVKDGFASYRFLYQNMRDNKEDDYIFMSFWETPINTFIVSANNNERTFHNANLLYHIANGNSRYVKYDSKLNRHIPVGDFLDKIKAQFRKIVSPVNLKGQRQNLGTSGYFKIGESKNVVSLWDAIDKFFPYNVNFMVSVDEEGDLEGLRPNDIQKKLIKYAQSWIMPNKPFYTLDNKCIAKTRIDYEKRELIMEVNRIYSDFHYLIRKYGWEVPQLVDTLSSHFMRLKKQMRHIPNFEDKIREEDFNHFSVNRLKSFIGELKSLHNAVLNLTNEVPQEKRRIIFNLIRTIKTYDEAKLDFDQYIENQNCKHDKQQILKLKEFFYDKWDDIRRLFMGDKNFKIKIKNKDFTGMTEDKINKLNSLLNELASKLNEHVKLNC